MKIWIKSIFKSITKNIGRLLINSFVILLSLILSSGLGAATQASLDSFNNKLDEMSVSDITIKATKEKLINDDLIKKFDSIENISNMEKFLTLDTEIEKDSDDLIRLYSLSSYENRDYNEFQLIEGTYPAAINEVLIEEPKANMNKFHLNDEFKIDNELLGFNIPLTFKVVGTVVSPLYLSKSNEPSILNQNKDISAIVYLSQDLYSFAAIYSTDIYINLVSDHNYFSSSYLENVDRKKAEIENLLGENFKVLTLKDNASYSYFKEIYNKILIISYIIPIFFLLVCLLVNFITYKKMIDDERPLIACSTSLGISKTRIVLKYIIIALIFSIFGSILGVVLGIYLIPLVILPAFNSTFYMGIYPPITNFMFGLISALIILISSLLIVTLLIIKDLNETPADLLKRKSPKPGKKILLEHIKIIWKHLSFKYKSSLRNVFRRHLNFILTSLVVIGASILMFVGFGLLDVSSSFGEDSVYSNLTSSIISISIVIIFIAILLTILIIYNLASMNLEEREREIATLKVLGYHDFECFMYIFRETSIITLISLIIAVPTMYFVFDFVLIYLDFGNISMVKRYSYIATILIIIVSTFFSNIVLYRKIVKIDMNLSLKSID